MTLYINTASLSDIVLMLAEGEETLAFKKISAPRQQAEKLLPEIDSLLSMAKIKLSKINKIVVANRGGSFTSLRIGVVTANALGYALKIPVEAEFKAGKRRKSFASYSIVEPIYDQEPNIGKKK